MDFTEDFTLSTILCDEDDRLTLWGLARLFQDVAGDHSDSLNVGFEGLKPYNKAWVLTHVYYNILHFPTAGEKLTLKTWPRTDNGLIAPRDYQLIDSESNICATSTSNWVIIDMTSRKVCRLRDIISRFTMSDVCSTKYDKLQKIQMPEGLIPLKKIEVPYSALDHTRHVNNAEYIKWICDSIPELCKPRNLGRKEIKEFEINYLRETKYGDDKVSINYMESCSEKYFQIINSHGISVNAKVSIL